MSRVSIESSGTRIQTKSITRNPLILIILSAIAGASLETIVSNILSQDFSIGTNVAVLMAVIVLIVSLTLFVLGRVEGQVKEDTKAVAAEIRAIAQETYVRTNTATDRLNKTAEHIEDIATRMESQEMTVRYVHNGPNMKTDLGYQESLNRIRGARKSIVIIGDFSPESMPMLEGDKRNEYLEEIEQRIKDAIKDNTVDGFRYTRIVQRNDEILKNIRENGRRLSEHHMKYDEQAFVHCYEVQRIHQEMLGTDNGVVVEIRVSEPIPNCPSILLIDNEYMLFTLPIRTHVSKNNASCIRTDGVLIFRFEVGGERAAGHFEDILRAAITDAERVIVERPSDALYQKYRGQKHPDDAGLLSM